LSGGFDGIWLGQYLGVRKLRRKFSAVESGFSQDERIPSYPALTRDAKRIGSMTVGFVTIETIKSDDPEYAQYYGDKCEEFCAWLNERIPTQKKSPETPGVSLETNETWHVFRVCSPMDSDKIGAIFKEGAGVFSDLKPITNIKLA